ncbi:MAG: ABC transporter ATP-binding protein, partial [Hyphomicrobiales bacterium]|nr:ABC transporter ATP-binding protein [Hyphomicrobiales bacterium]
MIAAALAGDPDLIVADEPTTALDVTTQAAILGLFDRIVEARGTAILLVTHDLGVVAEFCDHVTVMYAGEIVHRAAIDAIFDAPLHPYTRALIAALPDPASEAPRLTTIEGAPPDPAALPAGCAFEPRCPLGRGNPICQTRQPRLRPIGTEQVACHLVEPRESA